MPNDFDVTVENPDRELNTGKYAAGAVIRVQWSATQAGTFADVSGTGSTPTIPVVTGIRDYVAYDPNGTADTWYRTRLENAGGTRTSDWETAFQLQPAEAAVGMLCDLADVRQRVGIATADATADEDLLDFIRQVTGEINVFTGRRFDRTPSSGTTTFTFDIDRPTPTLFVPQGIASVTLVEYATITGGTFTSLASTDWFDDPPATSREYGWPATRITLNNVGAIQYFYIGKRVVRMTGALGWATVPGDIASIALNAVVRHWKARQTGQSEVIGAAEFGGRLLRFIAPEEREALERYRVRPVG